MRSGGWTQAWRLALRDARGGRRRLLLTASTVVVGVAALVAIRSFGLDLEAGIAAESKGLLGADLEIHSRRPFGPEAEALFDRIGDRRAREVSLGTMAYFPASGGSRLVQLRAVDRAYPFYGRVETEPPGAAALIHEGRAALMDPNLLLQMGARVGDTVRVGEVAFEVVGRIVRLPGEVPTASLVGPRVLVDRRWMDQTGLIRAGSRVRYAVQFRLEADRQEVSDLVGELQPELRALGLEAESAQYRERMVGEALADLREFLSLTALAALLLGVVGVASAASLHARRHRQAAAVLRCIGADRRLPLAAFGMQSVLAAAAGTAVGAVGGLVVQRSLPATLGTFLPFEVEVAVRPAALLEAGAVGLVTAAVFSVMPLLPLRRVRPLAALRRDATGRLPRDPLAWLLPVPLVLLLLALMTRHGAAWLRAVGLLVAVGAVLGGLALGALALRAGARRLLGRRWPWVWRQGVANLHRPRNQTLVMVLALGSAVFLVATLALVGEALLESVVEIEITGGADMVLFDIQADQADGVASILREENAELLERVPVVPMRIAAHKGRPVGEVPEDEVSAWALRRDFNSTYRSRPSDAEELVEGEWIGAVEPPREGVLPGTGQAPPVPISLEETIARRLELLVGDRLDFDVQGLRIRTRVASLRSVDWQQVRPNFFVVFPTGVLEPAPQQIVMVARAGAADVSAMVQRRVVERYANVSVVDLALVLRTVDDVLAQVRAALRFLAGFVVLAGLVVLAAATLEGQSERRREGILLRTLGASRRQIARIGLAEYLLLGAIAAIAGGGLAIVAAATVLRFVLESEAALDPTPVFVVAGLALALTGLLGFWSGRQMTGRPVLEALRDR